MCLPYHPHPNMLPKESAQDRLEVSSQSHYAESVWAYLQI